MVFNLGCVYYWNKSTGHANSFILLIYRVIFYTIGRIVVKVTEGFLNFVVYETEIFIK